MKSRDGIRVNVLNAAAKLPQPQGERSKLVQVKLETYSRVMKTNPQPTKVCSVVLFTNTAKFFMIFPVFRSCMELHVIFPTF